MFSGLMVAAVAGALYLGLSGGHSEAARQPVGVGSDAVMGRISSGEAVDLVDFAHPTGRTIFEFTATWCSACRRLAPIVEEAALADEQTVLRIIDIGSWDSPVAQQYGIRSVPHLVLFEGGECVCCRASPSAPVVGSYRQVSCRCFWRAHGSPFTHERRLGSRDRRAATRPRRPHFHFSA